MCLAVLERCCTFWFSFSFLICLRDNVTWRKRTDDDDVIHNSDDKYTKKIDPVASSREQGRETSHKQLDTLQLQER